MKITKKIDDSTIKFESIKVGDVFMYDNELYMRVVPYYPDLHTTLKNAINLADGSPSEFMSAAQVIRVEAELIVKL